MVLCGSTWRQRNETGVDTYCTVAVLEEKGLLKPSPAVSKTCKKWKRLALTPGTASSDEQLLSSAPSAMCANHNITQHNGQLYFKKAHVKELVTCLHYKPFTL